MVNVSEAAQVSIDTLADEVSFDKLVRSGFRRLDVKSSDGAITYYVDMVFESGRRLVVYKSPMINGAPPTLQQLQAMAFEKHQEYIIKE